MAGNGKEERRIRKNEWVMDEKTPSISYHSRRSLVTHSVSEMIS